MKKFIIPFIALTLLLSLSACQSSKTNEEKQVSATPQLPDDVVLPETEESNVFEEPEATDPTLAEGECQLRKIEFTINNETRHFKLIWDNGLLRHIRGDIEGKNPISIDFDYDEHSNLIHQETSFNQNNDPLDYIYDQNGYLIESKGERVFNRKFKYKNGMMSEESRWKDEKILLTIQYTWENGLVTESKELDPVGKVIKTNKFYYDNKHNPLQNLGALLNPNEIIYGYAVGNAKNNLIKIETIFNQDVAWQDKEAGNMDTKTIELTYNANGYPLSVKSDQEFKYFYSCR